MIAMDDARWSQLCGGYRIPYDPRPALQKLASGSNPREAWEELWTELHHQGDVGDASYASLIALVELHKKCRCLDWNLYALAVTIEVERHRGANPPVPEWMNRAYKDAWVDLVTLALADLTASEEPLLVQMALAVIALGKKQRKLGAFLAYLDESELDKFLEERLA